jgi:hypothetical protein
LVQFHFAQNAIFLWFYERYRKANIKESNFTVAKTIRAVEK